MNSNQHIYYENIFKTISLSYADVIRMNSNYTYNMKNYLNHNIKILFNTRN